MSEITLSRIGVVGAGQMGGGIAQIISAAGYAVTLLDVSAQRAQEGKAQIAVLLDRMVSKNKITAVSRDKVLGRIHPVSTYEDLAKVDLVIEAATEDQKIKESIFRELNKVCRAGAILASNTSSISITSLAACTSRPDRVIGLHFMNPVPVMKLVEIIRGLQTSDETYEEVRALVKRLEKTPVVSRDVPGFIVNRVLMPMVNEACFALFEGVAKAEDIDWAITLGLNHPMGPLALADLIGLDTILSILEVLHRDLGDDKYRPCPLLRQYVAAGWLGRKSGRGFYVYDQTP